jgi:hypothetical protein
MRLKCNECSKNTNGFCTKLKEIFPNGFAMLYFGGVVDDDKHLGICGQK